MPIFIGIVLIGVVFFYLIRLILSYEVEQLFYKIAKENIDNDSFYKFYSSWEHGNFVFGSFSFSPFNYVKEQIRKFNLNV